LGDFDRRLGAGERDFEVIEAELCASALDKLTDGLGG